MEQNSQSTQTARIAESAFKPIYCNNSVAKSIFAIRAFRVGFFPRFFFFLFFSRQVSENAIRVARIAIIDFKVNDCYPSRHLNPSNPNRLLQSESPARCRSSEQPFGCLSAFVCVNDQKKGTFGRPESRLFDRIREI